MGRKTIGEMITDIRVAGSEEAQIDLLKKYDCIHLRELFRINFDPNIKFALPEGTPPYQARVFDPDASTHLLPEWRRIKKLFLVGGHPTLKQPLRESNFIGLLRCLEQVEADILCELKDKKLSGIIREVVVKAYPNLLPEPEPESELEPEKVEA